MWKKREKTIGGEKAEQIFTLDTMLEWWSFIFGPVEWKRVIYTRAENNESFSYMTLTWLLSALDYCIIIIK